MKKVLRFLSLPLVSIIGFIVFISLYAKTGLNIQIIYISFFASTIAVLLFGIFFKKSKLVISSIIFILSLTFIFFKIIEIEKEYSQKIRIFGSIEKITGFVSEFPENKNGRIDFKFNVCGINLCGKSDFEKTKPFSIIVKIKNPEKKVKRGDVLIIEQKIKLPQKGNTGFNYREYLFFQEIFGIITAKEENIKIIENQKILPVTDNILKNSVWLFRDNLLEKLKSNLSDRVYALVLSIFFGIRSEIDQETYKEFQNTGMLHLLAISGMNISFIGGMFLVFFRLILSKSKSFLISIFFLFIYIVLILYSPSSFRAFLMYGIQGMFFIFGIRTIGITVLCFSGIFMIFNNPFCIFDPGFQLSFLATSGILLFSKIVADYFPKKLPEKIKSLIAVTLSAFFSVFVLQWALFQKIQFFSLISSLFVVPVFEFMFMALFFIVSFYYITGFNFLIKLIEIPINIFLEIIKFLDKIPPVIMPEIPLIYSYLSIPVLVIIFYLILPEFLKFSSKRKTARLLEEV
jgi:competence protein ComEC